MEVVDCFLPSLCFQNESYYFDKKLGLYFLSHYIQLSLKTNINMNTNRRLPLIAVMLMLSILNFSRLTGNENIRTIQYISLMAIGALSALLIQQVVAKVRGKD